MTITPARQKLVDFSNEYLSIQQHVIIHNNNHTVKSIKDLHGKKVYVRDKTSYQERLLELKKSGLDIELVLYENVPTEELIRQVAEKEIEITVADTNIALLNRRYYPDIKIAFPITKKQSLGWAVIKGDRKFLQKVNDFFNVIKKDETFAKIYERYYANVEFFDYVDLKKFHKRTLTRLPKYEHIIKEESGRYGLDWRLIAAVIYQESHFDPWAKSYQGVRGLMQLTLATADELGIEDRLDPQQSIAGGVNYLSKIYERFNDIQGFDRMLYALAGYNIGYGHVRDAQQIARQEGLDPNKWETLKQTLPLLRYKKHYKKTKYGYARGTEAVRYVDRILTFYDILRRKSVTS
jgi:membrane-bound lytic murein transglycosylase F